MGLLCTDRVWSGANDPTDEMMTRTDELPPYLPYIYAAGNLALNALNVYWFYKMIASIRSRFDGKDTKDKKKR